jgi:hypothetical protein
VIVYVYIPSAKASRPHDAPALTHSLSERRRARASSCFWMVEAIADPHTHPHSAWIHDAWEWLYDHARPCTPLHHLLLLGACAATSAPWQMSLVLAIAAYNPPENETRNGNGVGPKAKKLTNWLHGQSGCMGKHLLIVADFSFPTYKSSSVTGNSMSMLRPRLSF